MRAMDVMLHDVVTVRPETDFAEAVKLLSEHDVSALPVVDAENRMVGILSEADLIHRFEIGTEKTRPWWMEAVTGAGVLAEEFAKSHGEKVGEIMTPEVVSVTEETPLAEVAALLERKRIKRVPVTRDGKLVGIISRSNLVQALASVVGRMDQPKDSDHQDPARAAVAAKAAIVDRFWQPQCYGRRRYRAYLGAGWVARRAQGPIGIGGEHPGRRAGLRRDDPRLLSPLAGAHSTLPQKGAAANGRIGDRSATI